MKNLVFGLTYTAVMFGGSMIFNIPLATDVYFLGLGAYFFAAVAKTIVEVSTNNDKQDWNY